MTTIVRALTMTVTLAVAWPANAQQPAPQPPPERAPAPHIQIPRVESAPVLDDYVNGRAAGVEVTGFKQREPGDLTPVSEPTTAFLSYDAGKSLRRVRLQGRRPVVDPRARWRRRESIFEDDFVAVHLDPSTISSAPTCSSPTRSAIQADGITSEGSGDDLSFDTVWNADAGAHARRLCRALRDPVQEPALSVG